MRVPRRAGAGPGREPRRRAVEELGTRDDLREFDGRLRRLGVFFAVALSLLGGRLYTLQVVRGDEYRRLASNNFVREIEIVADRGALYDVHGRVLAENRPAYEVFASPRLLQGRASEIETLAHVLNLPASDRDALDRAVAAGGRSDYLVARDITRDQLAMLESRRAELPGVYIAVTHRRHYPFDALTAHVVGFMNEIRADELRELRDFGYGPGDYVGRSGLERAFEPALRGAPGLVRQVVNVTGDVQPPEVNRQLLGDYRDIDAVPGRDLHLTLDITLQEIIQAAMADALSGAAVVLDPRDGTILGVLSKPSFDPNAWSGRLSEEEKRLSDNDPFHPMLDKSVLSYFPASTYKVITAIAALEEGIADAETEIDCNGFLDYGNRRFHCWNRYGHGHVSLSDALAHSCDVYFYQLGLQLGIDTLARYAVELGFGERTGLALNGESAGVVPTREWHEEHSPGGFQYGFTVNTSVGQGDTRTSPLQIALAYAALVNGGTLYYPRVVDHISTAEGDVVFWYPPRARRTLSFAPEHIRAVVDGLDAVVNAPDGTAHEQRLDYLRVVGKTGTAQVRSLDSVRLLNGQVLHWDRDHAWFVAAAPRDNPVVTVAVFLENGGQGSRAAAPVAMRILDRYVRDVLGWDEEVERWALSSNRPELTAPFVRAVDRLPSLDALRASQDPWIGLTAIVDAGAK